MTLWYPGRPPFCSEELIWLLTQFVNKLHELTATQDATKLQTLQTIVDEALLIIQQENDVCQGTDHTLNTFRTLFNDAFEGTIGAFTHNAWDALFEIATNMLIIRNELQEVYTKHVIQFEVNNE